MAKPERVINLLLLLLSTPRPLTSTQIRERIPGYGDQSTDAFHRMFERDKGELRGLGFDVVAEEVGVLGLDSGYRIRAEESQLGDLGLTPAEQAALSLAAFAWGSARDPSDAALGMLKLAAVSGASRGDSAGWMLPRVALDRNVLALMDAVARRKSVRFEYRTGGGGEPQQRTVDPHGLIYRGGGWYLAGRDHRRGMVLHFKMSRVAGTVSVDAGPDPDFEAPAETELAIPGGPWEGEAALDVRAAFSPDAAWWVERRTGATRVGERADGWIELALTASDVGSFAAWIAGFADDAVVLEPAEMRAAVVERLRALAGDA